MAASNLDAEAKLQIFLQWLQANGGDLRGCSIKHCGPGKGFGIFTNEKTHSNEIVMVVPIDLAITPMRVLQDPLVGPILRALYEEGDVDDRFLVMVFLMVERLRPHSPWKPYLDILPSSFGNPLWFTESELAELKGTTLSRASVLQKKKLEALYEDKVKGLVEELLHRDGEFKSGSEMQFSDFLWANSIFWTRALNIPFPHSYVFPEPLEDGSNDHDNHNSDSDASASGKHDETTGHVKDTKVAVAGGVTNSENGNGASRIKGADIIWAEGLVPGIDFCNHGLKAAATWEVDSTGSITGVLTSMYLILAEKGTAEVGTEISISYGNKGNEELLYLYGFCIDDNPDDFLMVHYPMEAFSKIPLSDTKGKLLEIQNAELRCLLPRSLLDHGFFSACQFHEEDKKKNQNGQFCSYSWSGQRKVPSYANRLIFPQEFVTALRTISTEPPPEYLTCLGDLYSVSWMEDSDVHNLRTESLKQQYNLVKSRTSAHNTYDLGSHVMEYGDLNLSAEHLYLYMGSNPSNDNATFSEDNSLPSFSRAVNQRDADLVYYWHKFKRSPEGSSKKLDAQRELVDVMSHRIHVDNSMELVGKLIFGSEKATEVLKTVRTAGQPVVDDWGCLKSMVRTFESHCGSLSQYGMKHMRSIANICNAGVKEKTMAEAAAQACRSVPANPWSSLHRGFSA